MGPRQAAHQLQFLRPHMSSAHSRDELPPSATSADASAASAPATTTSGSTLTDDGLDRKTLFVRLIPFDATSDQLSEFFSQFVPVKHAVIVNDDAQKSRGFGFVSFTMDDDTLVALKESKTAKFQGRFLRVDVAKRRDRKESNPRAAGGVARPARASDGTRDTKGAAVEKRRARLIVRNLPWSCKKPEVLKNLFSRYGAVYDAYIPKKKGGQMCGFGFVTMKKDAAAERAVKESVGLKIDGREVAVDLAVEKDKWEAIAADAEEDAEEEAEEAEETGAVEAEDDEANEEDVEDGSDSEDAFDNLNEINSDDEPDADASGEATDAADAAEASEAAEAARPKANRQEAFSVFVRNIPYDATAESLAAHFSRFGAVKYALPVIDKETGLARGSAFVAFKDERAFSTCVDHAPATLASSMLIADDVSADYVYDGRILLITSTVDRQLALRLAEKNSESRKEALGKLPGEHDKRNLFLLNEGRITEKSKLAQFISRTDLELREKLYKLRVQQLNKNPTLHLSLTRLAIRNLPRAMNERALKALGRKAIVQFATEVKEEKRVGLLKEELTRLVKHKHDTGEFQQKLADAKRKTKQTGVVKQAKVIMEVKGSGEVGRSRGYGFIEFRDHKCALMGLRWLNAHEVTRDELKEGLSEEEQKTVELEGSKRRLIAEFAIENAQVMKRRRDKVFQMRGAAGTAGAAGAASGDAPRDRRKRPREDESADSKKRRKGSAKKGNTNKGSAAPAAVTPAANPSGMSEETKKLIGIKRRRRKGKN